MEGVEIRKAQIVNEDERRKLVEISNGLITIKNLKVIYCKKGEQLLGNHYHSYPELMYMLKGKAKYRMKNIDTNEVEDYELEEGDVVFRTAFITHAGIFSEDSIIIDAAGEPYISSNFNDNHEVILYV